MVIDGVYLNHIRFAEKKRNRAMERGKEGGGEGKRWPGGL